jgi:hypothetical protein
VEITVEKPDRYAEGARMVVSFPAISYVPAPVTQLADDPGTARIWLLFFEMSENRVSSYLFSKTP